MITATGSQIITHILEQKGIKVVAGIPGGSILPLYDELTRSNIRHILVRQEQAGGFIAQGIARTTGKAAVCMATSGPGVMNLLTAIADARSDSIPLVAITGQVNRALIGTDAFQETDTFGLSMPICKHSVMVKSAAELLTVLPEAFRIAESGRQGPVLVDIPRDVQCEQCTFDSWPDIPGIDTPNVIEENCTTFAAKSDKSVTARDATETSRAGTFADKSADFITQSKNLTTTTAERLPRNSANTENCTARDATPLKDLSTGKIAYLPENATHPTTSSAAPAHSASAPFPIKSASALSPSARTPLTVPQNLDALTSVAADLFARTRRAVLFCGGGAVYSKGAPELVVRFSRDFSLPICTSLMGITVARYDEPLFCGMVGMHGSYTANRVMYDADLIFAIGVRFDDRATGLVKEFCPNAKIIHIDADAAEINKIYQSSVAIPCDAKIALESLYPKCAATVCRAAVEGCLAYWSEHIPQFKERMRGVYTNAGEAHPFAFLPHIDAIFRAQNGNAAPIVTTDVGQHQMFCAQCYPFTEVRELLTSGSLGTMGFGLPAAIGAALAKPASRVLCFSGDGSIMMNVQELATLSELDLNVTVIVFDNRCLGMVRQQQELLFNKNYSASIYDKNPDLVCIANGFGIKTFDIPDFSHFDAQITAAVSGKGPRFVRIAVDQAFNVLPFVPAGKANIDAWLS